MGQAMSSVVVNNSTPHGDAEASANGDVILHTPLTPREQEVLEALALGLGSKHAARELHISYETIRTHQRNIYRKLGARTLCNALNLYRSQVDSHRLQLAPDHRPASDGARIDELNP